MGGSLFYFLFLICFVTRRWVWVLKMEIKNNFFQNRLTNMYYNVIIVLSNKTKLKTGGKKMFRIGYDSYMRDAKTKEQYIAAEIALCLEQSGELPTIEDLEHAYIDGWNEEFIKKFGKVTENDIYTCLFNILKNFLKTS